LFFEKNADPKKDTELFVEIKYESLSQEKAADLLNRYIIFALDQAQADIRSSLESKVASRVQKLDYDARELREKYYADQTRRELLLKEANDIAKAVGQLNPVYATSDLVGGYQPPLYMFGTKAIQAEIRTIQNRKEIAKNLPKGEDNFISGLPEILLKIDELKTLKVDFEHVRLAIIDEKATKPRKAVKPKKALVLALAGVAGGMMGLMVALLAAAYKRRKQQTNE
jgi:chain length determinant protein (polysaccharide antigen chain regulator)